MMGVESWTKVFKMSSLSQRKISQARYGYLKAFRSSCSVREKLIWHEDSLRTCASSKSLSLLKNEIEKNN